MSQPAPFRLMKAFQEIQPYRLASAWIRMGLLLTAAIILSLWLAAPHVDANMLFQSPASPLAQPGFEQVSPLSPIDQFPVEQVPVQPAPAEQAPAQPVAPVEAAPGATPPVVEGGAPAPPTPEPVSRREREETPVDEEGGPSNFILDQAELIDTVVVSGAYIWLCCGVSLFLLVPLFLLFVYVRGRSKIIREEGY
ncbi:MAG: hypothetical protein HS126_28585 [Anaerolineales bacterium]|nr:hypothetical protein [Anaerolineales bacterium]